MARWIKLLDRYPNEITFHGQRTGSSETVWLTCERKNGERYVVMAFADNMRESKPLHFVKAETTVAITDKIIGWMRIWKPDAMKKNEDFDRSHKFFRKGRTNADRAKLPRRANLGEYGFTDCTVEYDA